MARHTAITGKPSSAKRRSRRLQKKLRIGAFEAQGFAVRFRFADPMSTQAVDAFWDAFIIELIERRGLTYGGGESGYVAKRGRGSAGEADRQAVVAWFERTGVDGVVVGPLTDAWYGAADAEP